MSCKKNWNCPLSDWITAGFLQQQNLLNDTLVFRVMVREWEHSWTIVEKSNILISTGAQVHDKHFWHLQYTVVVLAVWMNERRVDHHRCCTHKYSLVNQWLLSALITATVLCCDESGRWTEQMQKKQRKETTAAFRSLKSAHQIIVKHKDPPSLSSLLCTGALSRKWARLRSKLCLFLGE